jgi:hypothetical protein
MPSFLAPAAISISETIDQFFYRQPVAICSGFLPWWSNDVGTRDGFSVLPGEKGRAVVLFIVPQLIALCCCCDGGKGDLLMASSSIKGLLVLDICNCGRSKASNRNDKSKTLWSVHAWGCIRLDPDIFVQVEQGTHIVLHNNIAGFRLGAVEKAAVAPATCSFKNSAFFALMISKCSMLSSALCTALSFFLSCAVFAVGGCWVVLVGVGLLLVGLEPLGLKL